MLTLTCIHSPVTPLLMIIPCPPPGVSLSGPQNRVTTGGNEITGGGLKQVEEMRDLREVNLLTVFYVLFHFQELVKQLEKRTLKTN